jgi:mercuric ion transport protein
MRKASIPLVGSVLAGVAAAACCTGPLVLLLLGFGGAWIGNLAKLEPYRPLFIAVALVSLYMAYLGIFRSQRQYPCAKDAACIDSGTSPLYKWLFTAVLIVVAVSIASPHLVPLFYA